MKTLEDFTKKHQPRRRISKLEKYEKEITKLYDLGYSIPQIKEFLFEKSVEISERAIFKFFSKKDKKILQIDLKM